MSMGCWRCGGAGTPSGLVLAFGNQHGKRGHREHQSVPTPPSLCLGCGEKPPSKGDGAVLGRSRCHGASLPMCHCFASSLVLLLGLIPKAAPHLCLISCSAHAGKERHKGPRRLWVC